LENDLRLPEVTKDISTILSHSLLIVPRELTKSFVAYKPNEFDLDMEITGLSKSKTRTKSERFIITGASGI
jgi:16S rRNA C1402 (ribose-2'-O) methylase RsmI